jgi:sugar/nucleoside kinase (ribokinase family)
MSTSRQGLLAAGNWIIDHTKIIDVYPAQDTLCNVLSETDGNGGYPYNLLINLARLEAPFPLEALGLVGDDKDGETIRADRLRHRIDNQQLHTCKEAHTSYTDVMSVCLRFRPSPRDLTHRQRQRSLQKFISPDGAF